MSLIADTNPDQDGTIGGFEGEIKMLQEDTKVKLAQCQQIEYELEQIPTLASLVKRLEDMETKQESLTVTTDATEVTIENNTIITTTWQDAIDNANALDGEADMLASDINDLVMGAEANMLEAMNQATNIQMLEDEFAKQQILFDFFFQNTSLVTIDNALWQPDNSCIMVEMNNYIEFFLSAVTTLDIG